jgi:hydrogenase/urease accessory protein HupE
VLVAAGAVALQTLILLAMGHPLICACGHVALWHGNPSGPETSQHLTDWYSYTHVVHGLGLYLLLSLVAPRTPFGLRLALAIGLEAAWEVVENTPFVMERYRRSALARGYFGDSVVNSASDTLAMALGFVLARMLPAWSVVGLVVAIELVLGFMIRDNLTLNIVQLIHPSEAISHWQTRR